MPKKYISCSLYIAIINDMRVVLESILEGKKRIKIEYKKNIKKNIYIFLKTHWRRNTDIHTLTHTMIQAIKHTQ